MRVLSDKSLETAKRAAMITAALTWLVSRLRTTMLPPQMKAVVEVLKQIGARDSVGLWPGRGKANRFGGGVVVVAVPIMGYAGGFIAWSWKTIQGFDKGTFLSGFIFSHV